jgi:hypothetical protein
MRCCCGGSIVMRWGADSRTKTQPKGSARVTAAASAGAVHPRAMHHARQHQHCMRRQQRRLTPPAAAAAAAAAHRLHHQHHQPQPHAQPQLQRRHDTRLTSCTAAAAAAPDASPRQQQDSEQQDSEQQQQQQALCFSTEPYIGPLQVAHIEGVCVCVCVCVCVVQGAEGHAAHRQGAASSTVSSLRLGRCALTHAPAAGCPPRTRPTTPRRTAPSTHQAVAVAGS